jgi:hypothetical protein
MNFIQKENFIRLKESQFQVQYFLNDHSLFIVNSKQHKEEYFQIDLIRIQNIATHSTPYWTIYLILSSLPLLLAVIIKLNFDTLNQHQSVDYTVGFLSGLSLFFITLNLILGQTAKLYIQTDLKIFSFNSPRRWKKCQRLSQQIYAASQKAQSSIPVNTSITQLNQAATTNIPQYPHTFIKLQQFNYSTQILSSVLLLIDSFVSATWLSYISIISLTFSFILSLLSIAQLKKHNIATAFHFSNWLYVSLFVVNSFFTYCTIHTSSFLATNSEFKKEITESSFNHFIYLFSLLTWQTSPMLFLAQSISIFVVLTYSGLSGYQWFTHFNRATNDQSLNATP